MKRVLMASALLAGCAAQPPPAAPPDPPAPPPKPAIVIPDDPMANLSPQIRVAIEQGQAATRDGIATLNAYQPNRQWTIYCWPLHVTEIRLGDDESIGDDSVIIGDKDRWKVQVLAPNIVRVQPLGTNADPSMSTDMVVDTGKRSYRFVLKLREHFTQTIGFFYPGDVKAAEAARQAAIQEAKKQ